MQPKLFQQSVLTWFDQHGRKNLPWQHNPTPYRIWVSEIMLQQTQVSTVIPYFLRFMERFPNVKMLAQANDDDVLHLWSGLGYYSRARNLLRTAMLIHSDYNNKFPRSIEQLQALPGIGPSTAGAIASLSMNLSAPILDGNVKRVLTRFHRIVDWPGATETLKQLWALAENYTPKTRCADYTQAMMDLGAMICTRSQPKCPQCPLVTHCLAHQSGCTFEIPARKPRDKIPVKSTRMLIICHQARVLLEKRPPVGIWGGLWSFPECALNLNITQWCQDHLQVTPVTIEAQSSFRHTFSHFHLEIHPIIIPIPNIPPQIMDSANQLWYNLIHPAKLGLAAPVTKLLQTLTLEDAS